MLPEKNVIKTDTQRKFDTIALRIKIN